jgi:hypothetical protein
MTVTQTGIFARGTSGFPIYVQLPDDLTLPANANFLSNVGSIHLTLIRPDGTTARDANLTLPGAISDVRGVVVFTVAVGELTLKGFYTITLTVTYTSPVSVLVVDGDFEVTK